MSTCGRKTEVFSRVVGYHRPVENWNKGKQEEFKDRQEFDVPKDDGEGQEICQCQAEQSN